MDGKLAFGELVLANLYCNLSLQSTTATPFVFFKCFDKFIGLCLLKGPSIYFVSSVILSQSKLHRGFSVHNLKNISITAGEISIEID